MKLNFKEIIEGWRNLINPPLELKELIEESSRERLSICNACPFQSDNAKRESGYSTLRMDLHCTKCGCPLATKTRSLSSACPIGNWLALADDETRYEIEQKINENNQLQEGNSKHTEDNNEVIS